jgi:5'-nucleotidase
MLLLKPDLAIDLDGTAALWDPRLNSGYVARGYPNHPMLLDPRLSYNLQTGDPLLDRITAEVMNEPHYYEDLLPMPGFVEAVPVLEEYFNIKFFSQPWPGNKTCASDKYNWIETVLGEKYVPALTLTYDKTICAADLLIDDKPVITGSRKPSWMHVLFDQPYNKSVDGPRIMDWSEPERIALYLNAILNEQKVLVS